MCTCFSNIKSFTPGPGSYEATPFSVYKPRTPAVHICKRLKSGKRDGPGPGSYDFNELSSSFLSGIQNHNSSHQLTKAQLTRAHMSDFGGSQLETLSADSSYLSSTMSRSATPILIYSEDMQTTTQADLNRSSTHTRAPSHSFGVCGRSSGGPFDVSYAMELSNIGPKYNPRTSLTKATSPALHIGSRLPDLSARSSTPGPGSYSLDQSPDFSVQSRADIIRRRSLLASRSKSQINGAVGPNFGRSTFEAQKRKLQSSCTPPSSTLLPSIRGPAFSLSSRTPLRIFGQY
ncbi:Hypothetical protein GSB_152233 [Giardia duodenalis]|uniref:Uncharacterized protein n=2 Tax=Giardia intestinalis TaxID=5741 RepID=C6LN99_GIAIB|nr:Hypothetical protein GL50581_201 [Giardia intestinalis ATCC 50581]ESU42458.1 Hypothetical protein GSB_152233 [Giardia intestinalis]